MIDCSELSQTIYDMVRHHVQHTKGIGSVNKALDKMQKDFPSLDRTIMLTSLAEASAAHTEAKGSLDDILKEVEKSGTETQKKAAKAVRRAAKDKDKPITVEDVQSELAKLKKGVEGVDAKLATIAKRFVKAFYNAGHRDRLQVTHLVTQELQAYDPDITQQTVVDAISDYGKFTPASTEPEDVFLAGVRSEQQKLRAIEDMQRGNAPQPTGTGRQDPTDVYRALTRVVNEAKKKGGYNTSDHGRALRSAIDAIVRRLENSIKDLQREIDSGAPIVLKKGEAPTNEKIKRLRVEKAALKKQRDYVFRDRIDAERTAKAIVDTQKSIDRIINRIMNREFDPPATNPVTENAELKHLRSQRKLWQDLFARNNPNAPSIRAAKKKIAELEGHLANGTVPQPRTRTGEPNNIHQKAFSDKINDLKQSIKDSPQGRKRYWEKRIADVVEKLKDVDYAPAVQQKVIPLTAEERQLEYNLHLMQKNLRDIVNTKKPRTVVMEAVDILGLSRAVKTAVDLSAAGRQGIIALASHPSFTKQTFKDMFKALGSEQGFWEVMNGYETSKIAPYVHDSGTFISTQSSHLGKREEIFATTYLDRIAKWSPTTPQGKSAKMLLEVMRVPVRASERAYIAALTAIRQQYYQYFHETLGISGTPTLEERKAIGHFVNVATGRGSMGDFEQVATKMNGIFFAPRYVMSRFQYIFGEPLYLTGKAGKGLSKAQKSKLRKEFLKEYGRFGAALVGTLAAASMLFGDDDDEFGVEWDPRSSDFAKMRFGITRVDIAGGLSQAFVVSSKLVSTTLEAFGVLEESDKTYHRPGYGREDVWGMSNRFLRTKLSPVFGTFFDVASGRNVIGEEIDVADVPKQMFWPLAFEDIEDSMKYEGYSKGTILSTLAILGIGVQVHKPRPKKKTRRTR